MPPNGLAFHWHGIDPQGVKMIELEFPATTSTPERRVILEAVYPSRPVVPELLEKAPARFFPFIDRYGQYKHAGWPGKIRNDDDLQRSLKREDAQLAQYPAAPGRSRFGGDLHGPRLKGTGRFRVKKLNGRWFLVDPEGYLFWSAGICFVGRTLASTEVKTRRHFFEDLPATDSAFARFYSRQNRYFNHAQANLFRKYGPDYVSVYQERCLRRVKSWGFNTLGCWSVSPAAHTREKDKVPYTLFIDWPWRFPRPRVNEKLQDVYHPEWKRRLFAEFSEKARLYRNDPWLIGIFVNNELYWGNPNEFVAQLLSHPGRMAGKTRFVHFLKQRLGRIERLNQLLQTSFSGWQQIETGKLPPRVKLTALSHLNEEYYLQMCEDYFRTIREAMDRFFPGVLYLGCRWHGRHANRYVVSVGAKYIDVLSFNHYGDDAGSLPFEPSTLSIDKPFLISEFHFGALDRGVFGVGLNFASDQRHRGERYRLYVESALHRKHCVGAHWFMMADEATAGFNDAENYNCGFLSIADQPYEEFIRQVRMCNYSLYQRLLGRSARRSSH